MHLFPEGKPSGPQRNHILTDLSSSNRHEPAHLTPAADSARLTPRYYAPTAERRGARWGPAKLHPCPARKLRHRLPVRAMAEAMILCPCAQESYNSFDSATLLRQVRCPTFGRHFVVPGAAPRAPLTPGLQSNRKEEHGVPHEVFVVCGAIAAGDEHEHGHSGRAPLSLFPRVLCLL